MKKKAILQNSQGVLLLVEPDANLKKSPPAVVWNPNDEGSRPFILDSYEAAQKWCQWWAVEPPTMVEVPDDVGKALARWAPGPNAQWRRLDEPDTHTRKVSAEQFVGFRERSDRPGFLSDYDADWYRKHGAEMYKVPGKDAGYAIYKDPETGKRTLISLHNNAGESGLGKKLAEEAIKVRGVEALDCFSGFLPKLYSKLGMREVERLKWDEQYAPKGWDHKRDDHPDVVLMEKKEEER